MVKVAVWIVLGAMFLWGLLFLPAGRWDWPGGWLCFLTLTAQIVFGTALCYLANPELLEIRQRFGPGTPDWDKALLVALHFCFCAVLFVAGMDRGRPALAPPPWAFWSGLVLQIVGWAVIIASMRVNRHFETTVRYQEDRGHRLIDRGPYAVVRHPGYAGGLLFFLGIPLMLGSPWSVLAMLTAVPLLMARTFLEEAMLMEKLDGYRAYQQRVRYRYLPWIW